LKLPQDVLQMLLDGALADDEPLGDVAVSRAAGDQDASRS
jgi:hypothetical protein